MRRINNKGFTLVELIATIVILAIIVSIGAFSITSIIKSSKEKDYQLLVKNILDASELYYQECKYSGTGVITCDSYDDGSYDITLNDLVINGFLKGNASIKDSEGNDLNDLGLTNPKDDIDISGCNISITYGNGEVLVSAVNPTGSCPTTNDYNK